MNNDKPNWDDEDVQTEVRVFKTRHSNVDDKELEQQAYLCFVSCLKSFDPSKALFKTWFSRNLFYKPEAALPETTLGEMDYMEGADIFGDGGLPATTSAFSSAPNKSLKLGICCPWCCASLDTLRSNEPTEVGICPRSVICHNCKAESMTAETVVWTEPSEQCRLADPKATAGYVVNHPFGQRSITAQDGRVFRMLTDGQTIEQICEAEDIEAKDVKTTVDRLAVVAKELKLGFHFRTFDEFWECVPVGIPRGIAQRLFVAARRREVVS